MFGTKKFLLLLLATLMVVGSIDAAAVPARQLSSKKDGGMEEEEMSAKNSSKGSSKGSSGSAKGSKKAAMHPAPTDAPMTDAPAPTDAPMTDAPKGTDAPKMTDAPDAPHPPMESKKASKKGSGSYSGSSKSGAESGSSKGGSGSGKGDSGKGSKKYSYSSSGKGKGGKGKGSKKGSKRAGKGASGDDVDPHAPTAAPAGPDGNSTAAPTSMDSFAVRPAPYALYYTFENDSVEDATIDQFNELADATREFLEEFFTDKYEQTSIIILDDFLTFLTRSDAAARPAMGVFRSVARFNPRSIFYPPRSEIESEIKLAFTEPASQLAYLKKLGDLPDGNPFKTVASITYGEPSDDDTVAASTVSTFARAGIAAAAAGVVVLVAGIAILSRNSGSDEDASVDSNFPPAGYKKTTTGSVAGETCAGTTWRSSVNEEELQDEPLDDDTQRHTSKLNVDY